ncbi:DNA polymerase III subunit delta' C-terminal domain-containing protein [Marinicellulosiphila megalodicopiae]|uniref:DNA polymerase III subunit delta' C-terminal domain-containing protein n=1 Tax=Marinicellulosiphila megalodicopiae TaxID=2724896 RepID=UPI003BAF9AA3
MYIWQNNAFNQIIDLYKRQSLPHALLLSSDPFCGVDEMAIHLANALLCEHENKPCGECRSCLLQKAGTHPDFMLAQPPEGKHILNIETIREMIEFAHITSSIKNKVIVIQPADAMNEASSNAILKLLEEPSDNTFLIMVSTAKHLLLPTIISRCQKWHVPTPEMAVSEKWLIEQTDKPQETVQLALNQSNHQPIRAKSFLENDDIVFQQRIIDGLQQLFKKQISPVQLSSNWQKENLGQILFWLQNWLTTSIKLQVAKTGDHQAYEANKRIIAFTAKVASSENLFEFYSKVQRYNLSLNKHQNLNPQLILEDILIGWHNLIDQTN